MKRIWGQVHVVDSDDTLDAFKGLRVRCGHIMERALLLWYVDEQKPDVLEGSDEGVAMMFFCPKCRALDPIFPENKRRYVYRLLEVSQDQAGEIEGAA